MVSVTFYPHDRTSRMNGCYICTGFLRRSDPLATISTPSARLLPGVSSADTHRLRANGSLTSRRNVGCPLLGRVHAREIGLISQW
jgi:hypothetical protein